MQKAVEIRVGHDVKRIVVNTDNGTLEFVVAEKSSSKIDPWHDVFRSVQTCKTEEIQIDVI